MTNELEPRGRHSRPDLRTHPRRTDAPASGRRRDRREGRSNLCSGKRRTRIRNIHDGRSRYATAVLYGAAAAAYLCAGRAAWLVVQTRSYRVVDGADRWWPSHRLAEPTHVREQILDDIASAPTKKTATCSTEKGGRWPHFWPRRRLRRSSWQPRLFVLWCNEFLDRLNLRVRPAAGLIVRRRWRRLWTLSHVWALIGHRR